MTWATGLAIGETVWVVGLCVWIIMERRSPVSTLAWIFCLAWLPMVGIPIYLLIGPRRLKRKNRRYHRSKSQLAEALRNVRISGEGSAAESVQVGNWRPLMQLAQRAGQRLLHPACGSRYLPGALLLRRGEAK